MHHASGKSGIMHPASYDIMKYDFMQYDVMTYDIMTYDVMEMKKPSF